MDRFLLFRTFDELGVGDTQTTRGRTITEADIVNWCALILNPHEMIHGTPARLSYDAATEIRDQMIAADTIQRISPEGLVFGAPELAGGGQERELRGDI